MTLSRVSTPSHAYCAAQETNMSNMSIIINNIISEPSVFTKHHLYSAEKIFTFIIVFGFKILVCLVIGIGFNIYHLYEEQFIEEQFIEEQFIEEQVPGIFAARCPCWIEDDECEYSEEDDEYSEEDDEIYDKSYEPSESEDDDYCCEGGLLLADTL